MTMGTWVTIPTRRHAVYFCSGVRMDLGKLSPQRVKSSSNKLKTNLLQILFRHCSRVPEHWNQFFRSIKIDCISLSHLMRHNNHFLLMSDFRQLPCVTLKSQIWRILHNLASVRFCVERHGGGWRGHIRHRTHLTSDLGRYLLRATRKGRALDCATFCLFML